jgi:uroporphyrinogen-III synthase/uroporphyrinogen III methyltransferase/synthase
MLCPVTPWRVAITRDESTDGPLTRALRDAGFVTVPCPVAEERPPTHKAPLLAAAADLERYDWAIFASRRAVTALASARAKPWPPRLRSAAVGPSTAAALLEAGAIPPPIVAPDSGADALWAMLKDREKWNGKRVLIPAVSGGRRAAIDGLISAGAQVTVVEAYRMEARPAADVGANWRAAAADAVILLSPSTVDLLVGAIGRDALAALSAIVAIGATTAVALKGHGIEAAVSPTQSFTAAARTLADLHRRGHNPAVHDA